MDGITIGGPEPLVASDVKNIDTNHGGSIGLNLNFIKCEQINISSTLPSKPTSQFPHCTINNATLLGAPFVPGPAMDSALGKKLDDLKRASERLQLISAHDALVLLRTVRQSSCTSCVHHLVLVTHCCLTSIIAFVLL